MQNYLPPFPKIASGRGTVRVSSAPQTLDQMLAMVQHFKPNSGVKQPKVFGRLNGFKPMTIPIVFHCEYGCLDVSIVWRACSLASLQKFANVCNRQAVGWCRVTLWLGL
jgi:hypothetical protein